MNSNHEASFEYRPMQTEMNNDVTHSTINNKLSELSSEIENVLEESDSFLKSNMNSINLNTLQSLRISHSNLKDDATTLLDRMKGITNEEEENEERPIQKIQIRKDIFDNKKGSNSKKINISQLDIKIGNKVNKEKKIQSHKILNISKRIVNTKPSLINNHRNITLPTKSKGKQNNIISNERSLYKNTSIQKTELRQEKKRPIYSSVKKISSKQSFFDIMQKLTVKGNRASSYKKSNNTNYTSNRSSSVTNKTINNPTSSTIDNNSKKRASLIPLSGVKGKNPIPYISNFAYCATEQCTHKKTVQKRPISQKQQKKPMIVTLNNRKKKIPLTTTHGNKKFNFNMNSYLQAITNQYHTITECKKKTTNSFFGSHHYSNVNTINA